MALYRCITWSNRIPIYSTRQAYHGYRGMCKSLLMPAKDLLPIVPSSMNKINSWRKWTTKPKFADRPSPLHSFEFLTLPKRTMARLEVNQSNTMHSEQNKPDYSEVLIDPEDVSDMCTLTTLVTYWELCYNDRTSPPKWEGNQPLVLINCGLAAFLANQKAPAYTMRCFYTWPRQQPKHVSMHCLVKEAGSHDTLRAVGTRDCSTLTTTRKGLTAAARWLMPKGLNP